MHNRHHEGLWQHNHDKMLPMRCAEITRDWLEQIYWFDLSSLTHHHLEFLTPNGAYPSWPVKSDWGALWKGPSRCEHVIDSRAIEMSRGTNFQATSFFEPYLPSLFLWLCSNTGVEHRDLSFFTENFKGINEWLFNEHTKAPVRDGTKIDSVLPSRWNSVVSFVQI